MPSKKFKKESLWQLPEIGNVILKRNYRAKRLTISIRPNTDVRVTIPGFLPDLIAKQYVKSKKNWIVEKISELRERNSNSFLSGEYHTRRHKVSLVPTSTKMITTRVFDNHIQIHYPEHLTPSHELVQNTAKKSIDEAFRKEAIEYLPSRVKELATKFGFNFNTLRIKKTKSRWGSCSAKNNINLSIYLMKLPDELIDYIILHELTHTIHKNHGPNFWGKLNQLTGDAKSLAARVRKYRTGFYGN